MGYDKPLMYEDMFRGIRFDSDMFCPDAICYDLIGFVCKSSTDIYYFLSAAKAVRHLFAHKNIIKCSRRGDYFVLYAIYAEAKSA